MMVAGTALNKLQTFRAQNPNVADELLVKARAGDTAALDTLAQKSGVDKVALRAALFDDATAKAFGLGADKGTRVLVDNSAPKTQALKVGGTVAHLTGFRGQPLNTEGAKNVALLLPLTVGKPTAVAEADIAKLVDGIDLARVSTLRGPRITDGVKLEPAVAKAIAQKLAGSIAEKLAGVTKADPDYDQKMAAGLQLRLDVARANKKPDDDLSDLFTLLTAKAPQEAILDAKTGRVVVGEETPPLPPAVAKQLDPAAAMTMLRGMNSKDAPVDDAPLQN